MFANEVQRRLLAEVGREERARRDAPRRAPSPGQRGWLVPLCVRARSSAMRLLTHNMLQSPGTKNGYPLAIEVEKMEEIEAEFNADFMARMVEKIDYAALLGTLSSVRDDTGTNRPTRALLRCPTAVLV